MRPLVQFEKLFSRFCFNQSRRNSISEKTLTNTIEIIFQSSITLSGNHTIITSLALRNEVIT